MRFRPGGTSARKIILRTVIDDLVKSCKSLELGTASQKAPEARNANPQERGVLLRTPQWL
ncbi:MAG: hypothetical protein A2Z43_09660 [Syntrophobacterales bacterium RBG_19FT_COMBO_59_10]|nr:MAG: hypothetical protein A2Z43_09660 [Syntrophobacterales bacterium RBG_19FT_COMBO_59_10]